MRPSSTAHLYELAWILPSIALPVGMLVALVVTAFRDPLGRITDDPRHLADEDRYVLLGLSERQRLLAVMFTERGEAIRLISARKATRRERRNYEKTKS